jgi:hypothetical protein
MKKPLDGALVAVAAASALAALAVIRRPGGSRSTLTPISWDPRWATITAEIFFEEDNAREDRDRLIEEGEPVEAATFGMFGPGKVEYASFGRKRIAMAPFRGDIDGDALHKRYSAAFKKLKHDLGLQHARTGSYDDYGNLDVTIYDDDVARILTKVRELDVARRERMDAEDFELELTPFFRARDWRFYPNGFTSSDYIPMHKISTVGDELVLDQEDED